MSRKGHGQGGRARAFCAADLLRLCAGQRKSLTFLAALVLLVNAAVPYWHAAQKLQVWTSAYAEPQAKHQAAMAAGVECPLHHAGTSEKKGTDEAPANKKPCPLCRALQLFSPGVALPGFALDACAPDAVAASVPHRTELKLARYTGEQARPRAPPIA